MLPRSPTHLALGRALRDLREHRGLSQEALGHEAGLDRTYVSGIERGERNPGFETLIKLAVALDIQPSELLAAAEQQHGWGS